MGGDQPHFFYNDCFVMKCFCRIASASYEVQKVQIVSSPKTVGIKEKVYDFFDFVFYSLQTPISAVCGYALLNRKLIKNASIDSQLSLEAKAVIF